MGETAAPAGKFVNVGDVRMHYHEFGAGQPLIMLHGGGPGASGYSNFQRNVEAFAKDFRVLIPDLPGYGRSDKPRVTVGLYGYLSEKVAGFMAALDIAKADFVGNSLGGGSALKLAIDHPDKVNRLVLMGPGGGLSMTTPTPTEGIRLLWRYYDDPGPSRERLEAFLRLMVFDPSMLTEELIDKRYAASIEPDAVASPLIKASLKPIVEPLWRDFEKIKHKTLLIWGHEDRTIPVDNATLMMRLMPDARLYVIKGAGHWVQWERPGEFNRLVQAFLAD